LCLDGAAPPPDPGPLPELRAPDSTAEEIERALRDSPELDRLNRAAAAADARVTLAKRDYRSDYSVGGSYMYRGSLDPMVAVSLGIRLPVFRKGRLDPGLAAASGDAASLRSDAESLKIVLRTITARRSATIRAAIESARLLREGVLPLDRLSLDSALTSYSTGQGEFTSVLAGMSTLLSDRLDLAQRTLLIASQRAALEAVSLEPPPEISWGTVSIASMRASPAPDAVAPGPAPGSPPSGSGPASAGGMP
jgi:outer membrane protein TolC